MKKEVYEQANQLIRDIECMTKQIDEVEVRHHWINVSTPICDGSYSHKFQKELLQWLKLKREEYQKEFEELE